jgi:hypothetical protein
VTWHKCDVRIQCSPRLRSIGTKHGEAAQQRATLAWLAVLAVNAEHDCDGRLEPMYADLGYLATYCPALPGLQLRQAIEHLSDAALIDRAADGALHIPGWDETWRCTKTSTARVRLHRQLKAAREGKTGKAGRSRDLPANPRQANGSEGPDQ